jgi:transcriptional regulator with XRE-family HTH domain
MFATVVSSVGLPPSLCVALVVAMFFLGLGRRQLKLSQSEFAKKTGVDTHHVSMCERGVAWPTPSQLQRFAKVLGIPPEKVMERVPDAATVAEVAADRG